MNDPIRDKLWADTFASAQAKPYLGLTPEAQADSAVRLYDKRASSQQRETREAAEFSVRLSEFAIAAHRGESARMAVLADVLKSMFDAHVSAPQEAGKADERSYEEILEEVRSFTTGDGSAVLGLASKEAGKVEAVADEPIATVADNPFCPEGTSDVLDRYLPIGTELYLRPSQQALGEMADHQIRMLAKEHMNIDPRTRAAARALTFARAILAAAGGGK